MNWLPPIIEMEGEWEAYCERLYEIFRSDIAKARFFGQRVSPRKMPVVQGKPDGFWHVTSQAFEKGTAERIPDMRRCERVCWIGPMIGAAGTSDVVCWESPRPAQMGKNVVIALPSFEHVVILGLRRRGSAKLYVVLVTAFSPVPRRQQQFRRAYEQQGPYAP